MRVRARATRSGLYPMSDYLYDSARRLIAFDTVSSNSNRAAVDYLAGEFAPVS